jgi:diphthamide synthase (EF-2-diphthine--ammonia ligase)
VTGSHETAIRETVLDYFEGWFDGDPARMKRALHPGLAKRALADDGEGLDQDSAAEMVDATARGVGRRRDRSIDVRVIETYGEIATVVVHSNVYREYLHLARTRDGWKIVNALWKFV